MPRIGHSLEGLERGVLNSKKNIKVLEKAIEDERASIAEYRIMMSTIEEEASKKEEAEKNVHLVVDNDDI